MPKLPSGPSIGAVCYVAAQVLNLLLQGMVIARHGARLYAQVGLAQLTVLTLIFLGELGYGLYFVREAQGQERWKEEWSYAQGHRLIALTAGTVLATSFWCLRYGMGDEGTKYLLCAVPGIFLSLYNFSPLHLAQGRYRTGFLGMPLMWGVAVAFYGVVTQLPGVAVTVGSQLGLGLTLGLLAQALFFVRASRDRHLTRFAFGSGGNRMLVTSLKLSALSVLGIANERVTPFLLQATAPNFLPVYLLFTQILQGASGILSQVNRTLLRDQSSGADRAQTVCCGHSKAVLITLIVISVLSLSLAGTLFGLHFTALPERENMARLCYLTLFAWLVNALGSVEAMTLIAYRFEQYLFSIMLKLVLASVLFQFLGAWGGSADVVLWSKVGAAAAALLLCYRKLKVEPSSTVILACVSLSAVWCSLFVGSFGVSQVVLSLLFLAAAVADYRFRHRNGLVYSPLQ